MRTQTVPDPAPLRNPLACYATYDHRRGYAARDAQEACFFIDGNGVVTPLTDADAAKLHRQQPLPSRMQRTVLDALHTGDHALLGRVAFMRGPYDGRR